MSTPSRVGKSSGPFLKSVEEDYNFRTGSTLVQIYEGNKSECRGIIPYMKQLGAVETSLAPLGNGNWELHVRFPFGESGEAAEQPTDTHELDIMTTQPPVWNNTLLRATLSDANIGKVWKIVEDFRANNYPKEGSSNTAQVDAEADITTAAGGAGTNANLMIALFRLVALRGVEHANVETNVYRRTITGATSRQIQASYTGAGKIWLSSEIIAFEGLPNGWFFVLPSTSVWLKSKPRVSVVAHGKMQVAYTYTEAIAASSLLYDKYSGAVLTDYFWTAS